MANFRIATGRGGQMSGVNPALMAILERAAAAAPSYISTVEAFSGKTGRSTGTRNHPAGRAVDVRLYDANGNQLKNYFGRTRSWSQADKDAYQAYEAFAQTARQIQERDYPQLSDQFRWGGYFRGGVNPLDAMHFDVSGGRSRGTPPQTTRWTRGLDSIPGVSLGMAALDDKARVVLGQNRGYQSATGATPSRDDITRYIEQAAAARGIDPTTAIRVARGEGLYADPSSGWQSNVTRNGVREPSYGVYQLYTNGGLGNEFMRQTGYSPSDPNTVYQAIDFALDHAAQNGWGDFHGAAANGVGNRTGLENARPIGIQASYGYGDVRPSYDPAQLATNMRLASLGYGGDNPPMAYSPVLGTTTPAQAAATAEATGAPLVTPASAVQPAASVNPAGPKRGMATLIEPTTVPVGPYGAQNVVRAAASGDPGKLQSALDNAKVAMYKAITSGQQSYGDVKKQFDDYMATVSQVAPGAVRAVRDAVNSNRTIATMAAPFRQQLDTAFASLPTETTRMMPLPQPRPAYTPPAQTNTAQVVADNIGMALPRQRPTYAANVQDATGANAYGAYGSPVAHAQPPDYTRIAEYRPAIGRATDGTSSMSPSAGWRTAAANAIDQGASLVSNLGRMFGSSPAQAEPAQQQVASLQPAYSQRSAPRASSIGTHAAMAETAVPANTMTLDEFRARFGDNPPRAVNQSASPVTTDYERLTGQAPPTFKSLMGGMFDSTAPVQTQSVVPTVTPTDRAANVARAQNQAKAAVRAQAQGASGDNSGSSSSASNARSPGFHGSYVVNSSGTVYSPSEYVESMNSGNWHRRGGRVTTYRSVR